jgi:undecaprenyl-diphosphatase
VTGPAHGFAACLTGALAGLGGWGYALIFLLVYMETGLLIPVPAETALVVASFLAGRGHYRLAALIAVAAAAAVLGDLTAYTLGRTVGRRRLLGRGRFLFLRAAHLGPVQRYFARFGGATVFFGRFVALLRIGAAFVAGMSEMPLGRFVAWNVSGGLVWAATFATVGYEFGQYWERIDRWIGGAGLVLLAVTVALVLTWARRLRRRGSPAAPRTTPASDGSPGSSR